MLSHCGQRLSHCRSLANRSRLAICPPLLLVTQAARISHVFQMGDGISTPREWGLAKLKRSPRAEYSNSGQTAGYTCQRL